VSAPFDLGKFRSTQPPAGPKPEKRRIPQSQHRFVKLPKIWIETLNKIPNASAATYRAAHFLIEHGWSAPGHVVKFTNRSWTMCREAKYKAIEDLRGAGLIAVEARGRKSPLITVRFLV
jgi:hypothetical protein